MADILGTLVAIGSIVWVMLMIYSKKSGNKIGDVIKDIISSMGNNSVDNMQSHRTIRMVRGLKS